MTTAGLPPPWLQLLAPLVLALGLGACAPRPVVPVSDLSRSVDPVQVYRIVRSGDTLYSVSWAAGVDYRELAAWNGIPPPYVIRPGQRLHLVPSPTAPPVARPPVAQTRVTALPDVNPGSNTPIASPLADEIQSRPLEPAQKPATQPMTPAVPPSPKSPAPTVASSISWQWPVRGRVVGGFDQNRGVDIAVPSGTPVKASASGRVVYAGSGLRGYGQLVILKHSDEFLSAYGHNRKLLVQEGDSILSGQVIAESGSAPGKGDQLHFEIRRLGKPVDPVGLLSPG